MVLERAMGHITFIQISSSWNSFGDIDDFLQSTLFLENMALLTAADLSFDVTRK